MRKKKKANSRISLDLYQINSRTSVDVDQLQELGRTNKNWEGPK